MLFRTSDNSNVVSQFYEPPYSSVVNGITVELQEVPIVLPSLNCGEVLSFFCTAGNDCKIISSKEASVIFMDQPRGTNSMELVVNSSNITSHNSVASIAVNSSIGVLNASNGSLVMDKRNLEGVVQSTKGITEVVTQISSGGLSSVVERSLLEKSTAESAVNSVKGGTEFGEAKAGAVIQMVTDSGKLAERTSVDSLIVSKTGGDSVSGQKIEDLMATEAGDDLVAGQKVEDLMKTETVDGMVSRQKVEDLMLTEIVKHETRKSHALVKSDPLIAQDEKTDVKAITESGALKAGESEKKDTVSVADAGAMTNLVEEAGRRMKGVRGVGNFWGINEEDTMGAIIDSAMMSALSDEDRIPGFYDSDNIRMETDEFIVSSEEVSAFLAVLNGNKILTNLLNRAYSASFREDGKEIQDPEYRARMDVDVIGKEYYHGQVVIYSLSVRNNGNAPLYDLIIINSIPNHARFETFTSSESGKNGYINHYMRDEGQVLWKLYRPLKSGETFKASFVVRLDRWNPMIIQGG